MISILHDPADLKQTYLGPELPNNITRKHLSYASNKVPAYIPDALLSPDYFNFSPIGALPEKYVQKYAVDNALLGLLKKDIENHVEVRIQNFVNQLFLVYKTSIQFSLCTQAEMQVGVVETSSRKEGCYAAAHSSTLPTLRLANGQSVNTSISFAKDSFFYYAWNMTIYLPTIVNQIDIKIDTMTRHDPNQKDLRSKATDILNQVSSGTLSPESGLRQFLDEIISVARASIYYERNKTNLEILETYLKISEEYRENVDNGYPLLQKLFFRPIEEKIDDLFYSSVQADIHSRFKTEMHGLMPACEAPPTLVANFDAGDLKIRVAKILADHLSTQPGSSIKSKKGTAAKEHIKCCTLSKKVEGAAIRYFNHLHQSTEPIKDADLRTLLTIKSSKTISRIGLSPSAMSLYQAALEATSQGDPRNMPRILLSVLHTFLQQMTPPQPSPVHLQPKPVLLFPEQTKNYLIELIQYKITQANLNITSQVMDYATICIQNEAVRSSAMSFISELISLYWKSLASERIDDILSIKTARTLPCNLSASTLALHREVLAAIRKSNANNSEITPQNMGLILCFTLYKGLFWGFIYPVMPN